MQKCNSLALFLFLFCLPFVPLEAEGTVLRSDVQRSCLEIMGTLTPQTELKLPGPENDLNPEEKNWCTEACIVFAAQAVLHNDGKPIPTANELLARLAHHSGGSLKGAYNISLTAHGALALFAELGYIATIKGRETRINTEDDLLNIALPSSDGMFATLSVANEDGDSLGHALLVTGIDREKKQIKYIDPNDPNRESTLTYTVPREDGGIYIQAPDLGVFDSETPRRKQRLFVRAGIPYQVANLRPSETRPSDRSSQSTHPKDVLGEARDFFRTELTNDADREQAEALLKTILDAPTFQGEPSQFVSYLERLFASSRNDKDSKTVGAVIRFLKRMPATAKQ